MRIFVQTALLVLGLWVSTSHGQTSTLVFPGAGGKLEYKPYANWGQTNAVNTVPDFSHAGYKGGGFWESWKTRVTPRVCIISSCRTGLAPQQWRM